MKRTEAKNRYAVIVIGGGHAGCEAALSSARNGAETLLISINMDSIALMPFGGTVGGPGKGQLVKEIDALGGEISRNTDKNYINIRTVDDPQDPSLKTLQVLVDRRRYFLSMKKVLENQDHLDLRQGLAVGVERNRKGFELYTSDETVYSCSSLVVCTGTSLRGKLFWGRNLIEAGRHGEICSKRLPLSLENMGFKFGRTRSYAAPLIDRKTIDFSNLEKQPFDNRPGMFSRNKSFDERAQLNSYSAYIGKACISYILKNVKKKELCCEYTGKEEIGNGSSIEKRVLKIKGKESFKVFIQPVGRDTNEMYLQGLETMLAEEIQEKMIKKIRGLESIEITRPGYAVEYDYLLPFQIECNLEGRIEKNIFFAGQINGSGGYEGAAAQGMIAGISAARKSANLDSISIGRKDGPIGVHIRDLVAGGVKHRQLKP